MSDFPLILISAWNDSGGGFLHRLFDGHPQLFVYPFELQLGTAAVADGLAGWFWPKYRWPVLPSSLDRLAPAEIRDLILDDELKGYLRDRATSKFRAFDLAFSATGAEQSFAERLLRLGPTRAGVVAAYVASVFDGWENRQATGREERYLGHCPIVIVDADCILADFPAARIVHVVRNPFSGYADARRRRPELALARYCCLWSLVNHVAFYYAAKYPQRVNLMRFEDLVADRRVALARLCDWLGLTFHDILMEPTWNSRPLGAIMPFGGVPEPSAEHNRQCFLDLSVAERREIAERTAAVRSLLWKEEDGYLPNEAHE